MWRTWRFFRSWYFAAAIVFIAVPVIGGIGFTFWSWEWLQKSDPSGESNSTTLRNAALIVAGFLALAFAAWRGKIADSVSKTGQRGLQNERYQKGAEMLGSSVLATRLGGIYALQRLVQEDPGRYHIQIMLLLCSFVRHPSDDDTTLRYHRSNTREDVQSAMHAIGTCRKSDAALRLEQEEGYRLDLTNADLRGANLSNINLAYADLAHADLQRANLAHTNLTSADLLQARVEGATLTGARLDNTNVSNARLGPYVSSTSIRVLSGLTQEQVDSACADPDLPPHLEATNSWTGEALNWNQKRCPENLRVTNSIGQ